MNISYLIVAVAFLSCFFVAYSWFAAINRNLSTFSFSSPLMKDVFSPILVTGFLGMTALHFLLPTYHDQLFEIPYLNIIAIYLITAAAYYAGLQTQAARFSFLILISAAIVGAVMLPFSFLLFDGALPFWLDRTTVVLIWAAFAWCYKYLNGIDAIAGIQTIVPLSGMIILAFIGAIPFLTGSYCAILIAVTIAFLAYNWYPAKLVLTSAGCQALGFLVFWYFMLGAQEGAASCLLIFNIYFLVEITWAFIKKLSGKPRCQDITANTFYYQTNVSGLSPAIVAENIFKLTALLLIFGCFQAYAPNNYSLAILSVILVIWFLNHLRSWQIPERSFSEINKEVVNDIKSNVEDFKKNIDKDL